MTTTTRGPHVSKRRWKDRKTGEPRESKWYYICFFAPGPDGQKRRVIRRTDPPTDSKRAATEQLHAALGGKSLRDEPETTAGRVFDEYRAHLEAHSPSSVKTKGYWLAWLTGRFNVHPTLADVDHVILELRGKGAADGTIAGYLGVLKAAYRRAVRAKLIPPNEICEMKITLQSPVRTSVWTGEEIRRLCAALEPFTPWAVPLVRFLRETGIRIGDALMLRWDEIAGDVLRRTQQKTGAELHIPLSEAAVAILAEIPRSGPLVFPGSKGQKRIYRNVLRAIDLGRKRAGITGRTIHDLRRTLASELTNTGTPDRQIAALLGQRTTRIVGRYAHAELEALRESLERTRSKKSET